MIKIEKNREVISHFLDRSLIQEIGGLIFTKITIPSYMEREIPDPPFPSEEYLKEVMEGYRKFCGRKVTPRFAYFLSFIGSFLDPNMEIPFQCVSEICDHSAILEKEYFESNPYFSKITLDEREKKIGDVSLGYVDFQAGEFFPLKTFFSLKYLMRLPALGTYRDPVRVPALCEKDAVWMSITPSEIASMKQPIQNAFGDVLVLGCGLGYFPYMISLKENVKSITIVEKNKKIIELFETFILPQFEEKDKIRIVHADAIDYVRDLEDGKFSYCFADLWLDAGDVTLYLRLKGLFKRFRKTKVDYWIEDALVEFLLSSIFSVVKRDFYEYPRWETEFFNNLPEENQKNIQLADFLLEGTHIKKKEDLDFLLSKKGFLELLKKKDFLPVVESLFEEGDVIENSKKRRNAAMVLGKNNL